MSKDKNTFSPFSVKTVCFHFLFPELKNKQNQKKYSLSHLKFQSYTLEKWIYIFIYFNMSLKSQITER